MAAVYSSECEHRRTSSPVELIVMIKNKDLHGENVMYPLTLTLKPNPLILTL